MDLTPQQSILIVDDDHSIRTMLVDYFSGHGYRADGVATATDALRVFSAKSYDLALLDLGLPDADGTELARHFRERAIDLPIIFITGRSDEVDVVMGLELGADDYIAKPVSLRQVLARVRAIMRRAGKRNKIPVTRGKHPRAYFFEGWTLNLNTRKLIAPDRRSVPLTNAEFNLLVVFLSSPNRIISREELLERTRAFDDIYNRAIDVQILRLRRKIENDPKNPTLLRTARGTGYLLDADIEPLWN